MLSERLDLAALRRVVLEEPLGEAQGTERETDGVLDKALARRSDLERAAPQVADEILVDSQELETPR